jgi:hypothetical protein
MLRVEFMKTFSATIEVSFLKSDQIFRLQAKSDFYQNANPPDYLQRSISDRRLRSPHICYKMPPEHFLSSQRGSRRGRHEEHYFDAGDDAGERQGADTKVQPEVVGDVIA